MAEVNHHRLQDAIICVANGLSAYKHFFKQGALQYNSQKYYWALSFNPMEDFENYRGRFRYIKPWALSMEDIDNCPGLTFNNPLVYMEGAFEAINFAQQHIENREDITSAALWRLQNKSNDEQKAWQFDYLCHNTDRVSQTIIFKVNPDKGLIFDENISVIRTKEKRQSTN